MPSACCMLDDIHVVLRVMAHPKVIEWQKHWTYNTRNNLNTTLNTSPDMEMDSEEAISQFWSSAP
jgi:hypothetical protein